VLDPEAAAAALVTASASGQVKRTLLSEFLGVRQRSIQASGVKDGDELVAATIAWEDDDLVLAHDGGMVTRFAASEARVMGRSAAGVAGMQVPAGARLVALSVVPSGSDDGELVTIGADGTAWRVPLAELAVKGRGGKGIAAGRGAILWSGTAADLHLAGPVPRVLAPSELTVGKRGAKGSPLEGDVAGPIVAEVVPDAEGA
jgi:DNA gyrase subunit A